MPVLRTAEQGGCGGPFKHMIDLTGVEICWARAACLSARKETSETINFETFNFNSFKFQLLT